MGGLCAGIPWIVLKMKLKKGYRIICLCLFFFMYFYVSALFAAVCGILKKYME